jgi:hypothetical protein
VIAARTCTDGTVEEPAHDAGGGRLVATVTGTPIRWTANRCRDRADVEAATAAPARQMESG